MKAPCVSLYNARWPLPDHAVTASHTAKETMPAPTTVADVVQLVSDDMRAVDQAIREHLASDVVLIQQIAEYIIAGGGKRLRPMLVVLAARAAGYGGDRHVTLAAIIEFIHTATLLHDDVVDESDQRRGQQAAHAVWGNAATVLVGDFLYSRSFQMMVTMDSMRVMDVLADTTNTIAEGEVQQLLNLGDPEVSEERYLAVIEHKTARLFSAGCRLGAVLAEQPSDVEAALARYGTALGSAFQIADDVLDYGGDDRALGKNLGDDLAEGKPTLPLIHARQRTDERGRATIDRAIREGGLEHLPAVLEVVRETDALRSSMDVARRHVDDAMQALETLPPSTWREALATLARYAIERDG